MKLLVLFSLFLSQSAWSAAIINRVVGASVFTNVLPNQQPPPGNIISTPQIFGGMGGPDCSGQVTNTQTCNNCAADTLAVCNTQRVYPALQLRIEFVDLDAAGRTLITDTTTNNERVDLVDIESTENQIVPAGNTHVAVINWSTLCSQFSTGNLSDCTASFSRTLRLGVSENGTNFSGTSLDFTVKLVNPSEAGNTVTACDTATRGICNFSAYPGDEKVYLEDLESKGNFPSDSNAQFSFFRIIYSSESFDSSILNPREAIDSDQYKDIPILSGTSNTEPDLADNTVDGLENNTLYFFRSMLIDEANNLMDITDNSVYTNDPNCGSDFTQPVDELLCPLTARPDEVIGLLAEDFNCFISTVAYGSSFAPKVKDFRAFRRKFLLPYDWGRRLNHYYYQVGPGLSQFIKEHNTLKALARGLLYPLWAFAKLSVNFGLFKAFMILASIIITLVFFVFIVIRKKEFIRLKFFNR